ncbi:hypothetical protein K438DRAFT_1990091 [Mycena galopus ATCC 62051]|nr:hypothetical protein K438DRAFT_1990091 [Mycena galopus ATCC 62051]
MSCAARLVQHDIANGLKLLAKHSHNLHTGGVTKAHRKPNRGKILTAAATEKIRFAHEHAWAESTAEKYSYGLEAFHKFCDAQSVLHAQRLPACEELLCGFAASRAGEIAGGTARGAIAAVKAWHIINGAQWQGGIQLRYTLKGVENLTPANSRQDQRPPVTKHMIDILQRDLDISKPKDAAVFAAACCAFWGQIRLGEILSDTQSKYKAGRTPLVANLGVATTSAGSRPLHLPWTKTKGAKGDTSFLCKQNAPSDPINATNNHIAINVLPADASLFSYRNDRGNLICLSRKKFLECCNEVWSAQGIPSFTGHSFRIGGTTELLLAGVNPDVVQAMGRWLSDAFLVYWRRLDILAPIHAEFLAE